MRRKKKNRKTKPSAAKQAPVTAASRRADPNYVSPLMIGLVTHRHVLPQTMASCWAVSQAVEGGADLQVHALAYVDIGRNNVARKALEGGNPYLLFVDFDMDFPPETVGMMKQALDENPRIGAIAAHYIKWDGSAEPMAHWRREGGELGQWVTPEERDKRVKEAIEKRAVVAVDRFGTGCMLIRTEVLKDIPYPWFQLWFHPDWGHVGEDVHFCWELQKAGYEPACHFGAPAGHIGPSIWVPTEDGRGAPIMKAERKDAPPVDPEKPQHDDSHIPEHTKRPTHPLSDQVGGPERRDG
jgi:hypothetical protein